MKKGVLLINLGTPDSPSVSDLRRYLRQFLSDPRVIDIPKLARFFLVNCLILPIRPKKSAKAYQSIWTDSGSPLLVHSIQIQETLQSELGKDVEVALAMRYGQPSIKQALSQLAFCNHITIIPLFPQYSSAATGSAIEAVLAQIKQKTVIPNLTVINEFYSHPLFISAYANLIRQYTADFYLFSYHGLPERQIIKSGCKTSCKTVCPKITSSNANCYKAQCYHTTKLIAQELNLDSDSFMTSFQSRLGKTPWITPYTDETLDVLIKKGVKNISVCCPSFVADCLETLEEIGINAKEQWLRLGGEQFNLIPCLNQDATFIAMLKTMVTEKLNY